MIQWTDAPLSITVEGVDLTAVTDLHLTFSQEFTKIDLTEPEFDVLGPHDIYVSLDQEKSGMFRADIPVKVQLNYLNANGKRRATGKAEIPVDENLLSDVILERNDTNGELPV